MTEAGYREKILWRRAAFVLRSDAAGGLLSISALRREAADDIQNALPPRGSRAADAAEALRIYLDEPETLAPEKWLSEPVILSLPDAVQEALRAVSRIPFSETAAAGDLGIPAASVMDAVALNPLFPLIPTYRLEDVAREAGPRHNDGLWICGDLRELEKSSPVRWWY